MPSINLVTFMSWVPLVGSALGSVLGGFLSDLIVNRKSSKTKNSNILQDDQPGTHQTTEYFSENQNSISKESASRALIAGVSTLVSLPIVVFSFYLGFPGCFLIYIASGIVSVYNFHHSSCLIVYY